MNFLHSGKHREVPRVEIDASANRAEQSLLHSGAAVHRKAQLQQMLDHLLDLRFGRLFLHYDNHRNS